MTVAESRLRRVTAGNQWSSIPGDMRSCESRHASELAKEGQKETAWINLLPFSLVI